MATLILTAVGTAVGGPLGGAIGALVGRSVDQRLLGKSRQGPRLKDLDVQTSTYGSGIARLYGRMRVAGSVIWSTDLQEHREKRSGGKGQPSVVQYGYSVSLAVALSSRPIQAIGRIWADGKLLRGAAGDFKTPCTMRVHHGHDDQPVDPLIAQAEGAGGSPAFRGLAYVLLEDMDLAEYGNRIPLLTFEVIADAGAVTMAAICRDCAGGVLSGNEGTDDSPQLMGFAAETPDIASLIDSLSSIAPMPLVERNGQIVIGIASAPPAVLPISIVPAASGQSSGGRSSQTRRALESGATLSTLRFYQADRDFQPGLVRARHGNPVPGAVQVDRELPAAMNSAQAQVLIDRTAQITRTNQRGRTHFCAALGHDVFPGSTLVDPADSSQWLVSNLEWNANGCELVLQPVQALPMPAISPPAPGRVLSEADLANGATLLMLADLPMLPGSEPHMTNVIAAASSAAPGWKGAQLYRRLPDGALEPLGLSARQSALIGRVAIPPASARPGLVDWANAIVIDIMGGDASILANASITQIAQGRNLALLGDELIQFSRAEPLGQGQWRLSGLLRGLGGTEPAMANHIADEAFLLISDDVLPLPGSLILDGGALTIAALGLGDGVPVVASVPQTGRARRPLAPVHPHIARIPQADSMGQAVRITWHRRARGQWSWTTGGDVPLLEDAEAYQIVLSWQDQIVSELQVPAPWAIWPESEWGSMMAALSVSPASPLRISIRQIGLYGLSPPCIVDMPSNPFP